MTEQRAALLIATSRYDDPSLPPLRGVLNDVLGLAEVLGNPRIGGFDVHTVIDRHAHEITADVDAFLQERQRRELVVLYVTGHGIKGHDGQLYFAARNTSSERLRSTAVAASWVSGTLDACRSSRQLLLLDCCHSGAFVRGMTVKSAGPVGVTQQLSGRGRVIITASDAMQFALERGVEHEAPASVFTSCVVHGLRSGEADVDRDGRVTPHDLFDYVQDAIRVESPHQSPQMTAVGLQGEIVVARSPRVAATARPETTPRTADGAATSAVPADSPPAADAPRPPTAAPGRPRPDRRRIVAYATLLAVVLIAFLVRMVSVLREGGDSSVVDHSMEQGPLVWSEPTTVGSGEVLAIELTRDGIVAVGALMRADGSHADAAAWRQAGAGWERMWDPAMHEALVRDCNTRLVGVASSDRGVVGVGSADKGPDCPQRQPLAWWDHGDGPRAGSLPPTSAPTWMKDVAWDPQQEVFWAVGAERVDGPRTAAVWRSPDGRSWERYGDVEDDDGSHMRALEHTPAGLIAVGDIGSAPAAWRFDGAAWRLTTIADQDGSARSLAVGGGQVVVVGFAGDENARDEDLAAWTSNDNGVSWKSMDVPEGLGAGRRHFASVIHDGKFVASSRELDDGAAPVLWESMDGNAWRAIDGPEPRMDSTIQALVMAGDRIVGGGVVVDGLVDGRCACRAAVWTARRS